MQSGSNDRRSNEGEIGVARNGGCFRVDETLLLLRVVATVVCGALLPNEEGRRRLRAMGKTQVKPS